MTDHARPLAPPFALAVQSDKSRAFRAAERHSRRVRRLRWGMVGGTVLLVAGVAIVAVFDPFGKLPAGVSIEGASTDGSTVTISHPKLAGYRSDGRPYEIAAVSAIQDLKVPTLFKLNGMDARLTMQDKSVAHVTSAAGVFDSSKEVMDLTAQVHIVSDAGLVVDTQDAHVEFRAGAMRTDRPVTGAMRGNTIAADRMHATDGFRQVTFEGNVQTLMLPEATRPAPAAAQATVPAPSASAPASP